MENWQNFLTEMAWSADEWKSNVAHGTAQKSQGDQYRAHERYKNTIIQLRDAIQNAGGTAVIDPSVSAGYPDGFFRRAVADLWRMISSEAIEKYGLSPDSIALDASARSPGGAPRSIEDGARWYYKDSGINEAMQELLNFIYSQCPNNDAYDYRRICRNALGHDEPYFSAENLKKIEELSKEIIY